MNLFKQFNIWHTEDGRVIFDGVDLGPREQVLKEGRALSGFVNMCVTISGLCLARVENTMTVSGLDMMM